MTNKSRAGGLVLFLVFGALNCGIFLFGSNITGTADPSSQCSVSPETPDVGGPYYENSVVTGEKTFFPFGMICTYDSPDDEVGPQTVVHQQWLATIVWFVSGGLALTGIWLLLRANAG